MTLYNTSQPQPRPQMCIIYKAYNFMLIDLDLKSNNIIINFVVRACFESNLYSET